MRERREQRLSCCSPLCPVIGFGFTSTPGDEPADRQLCSGGCEASDGAADGSTVAEAAAPQESTVGDQPVEPSFEHETVVIDRAMGGISQIKVASAGAALPVVTCAGGAASGSVAPAAASPDVTDVVKVRCVSRPHAYSYPGSHLYSRVPLQTLLHDAGAGRSKADSREAASAARRPGRGRKKEGRKAARGGSAANPDAPVCRFPHTWPPMSAQERRQVDSLKKAIKLLQPRLSKARNENTRKTLLAQLNEHLLTAWNLREQLQVRATEKAIEHVKAVAKNSDRLLALGRSLIQFARTQKKKTSRAEAALAMNKGGAEGCSGKMKMTVKALKFALAPKGLDTRRTRDDLLRQLILVSLGEGIPNGVGGASFVACAAAKPGSAETSGQSGGGGAAALDAGNDAGEQSSGEMTDKELQAALRRKV